MTLHASIRRIYASLRKSGMRANDALECARTIHEWRTDYENEHGNSTDPDEGIVRLRVEPEAESYFAVYGEPEAYVDGNGRHVSAELAGKEVRELVERYGCWVLTGEYLTPAGEWVMADSVGMCAGYKDVLDPAENWYVPGIMRSTLDMALAAWEDHERAMGIAGEIAAMA